MLQTLRIDLVIPDENQPRRTFHEQSLEELAQSIRERGVLEPIVVRPIGDGKYQIIMGERRYRASILAGKEDIPAIIRDASDEDVKVDALLENFQREDLNPVDRARAIQGLLDSLPMSRVAKTLGVTEATIRRHLDILDLPEAVLDELVGKLGENPFTEGHARTLRALGEDPVSQVRLARKIKDERLSVEESHRLIQAALTFPDKKEAILRVPMKVAEEMIRHAARERDVKKTKPFKPQTAQTHAASLEKQMSVLSSLIDTRLTDYLPKDDCETLLATCTTVCGQVQALLSALRKGLSEDRGFQEIYVNCAVCGRIELISKLRCSTCWSVMKRCDDCAHYDRTYQRCSSDDVHIPVTDADSPSESSRSYKCEAFEPKFEIKKVA